MSDAMQISPKDNVAVALRDLHKGETIHLDEYSVQISESIPAGHKFAIDDLKKGQVAVKYGFPIGVMTDFAQKGTHVHIHNLSTLLSGKQECTYSPDFSLPQPAPCHTFMGYKRKNGDVGIRNELWIIPTVGCVNSIVRSLEESARSLVGNGIDHVCAFTHPYGCSQLGDDQENTRQILSDLATHPNCGGALIVGLGCENSGIGCIQERMGDFDSSRVRFMVCQQLDNELQEGMKLLCELREKMACDVRTPCPSSSLTVGIKCGGSDGFSGITSNPVIGRFSDMLVKESGSVIMSEVPEMFGAENMLLNRCASEAVFCKAADMINSFKEYFTCNNQPVYENPSPGNKAGGISTLEEKSIGCTQKSGFSPVMDVLKYGEKRTVSGLNLLSSPGNDLVSSTALAASGAQLILFSTGRGTPFSCPVPTVKISSNTPLAQKKPRWIDLDAGRLLSSGVSAKMLANELMELVMDVAGGKYVAGELNGFHDFAIFKTGVTL